MSQAIQRYCACGVHIIWWCSTVLACKTRDASVASVTCKWRVYTLSASEVESMQFINQD